MLFTGEYEHTIDAKQRLAIPSEIRARMKPEVEGDALYLAPGANRVLWLWPERTFDRISSLMKQSLIPDQNVLEFERYFFSRSRRVDIDSAGRIRIPEQMIAEYGLGQSVMIVGVKDHMEIHDLQQWRRQRAQFSTDPAELMLKARQAMEQHHNGSGGSGGNGGSGRAAGEGKQARP